MKRADLKEKGLTEEQIDFVMSENGKDIESTKKPFADYDEIKEKLSKANETLEKFKDYDNVKADVEKYKAEAKKIQDDFELKIAKMEREGKVKEYTSSKKFVNDFTRDSINSALMAELEKEESKGKSLEDLFTALTKDKKNVLVDEKKPTPPNVPPMKDAPAKDDIAEQNKVRGIMGLPPLKD